MQGFDSAAVVIVGAGQAGGRAAETLRGAGFQGSITMIGGEAHLPYERPQLSKSILLDQLSVPTYLRSSEEWSELGVSVLTGLLKDYLPEAAGLTLKRFWYDTITYDAEALRYLGSRVGTGRLVVGSDYPFAIKQNKPVTFARQALETVDFAANATELLAGSEIIRA